MRIEERVIVKYNPKYYDAKGVYTKDEWTDFSDIGKEFEGETSIFRRVLRGGKQLYSVC